jgi:uncharacterized protein (DUF58 family)
VGTLALGRQALQRRFVDWVTRGQDPAARRIRLHRRRIYILPTRHGYAFALLLLALLLGAMNYNNSLVFGLTFLLAALGANAMWLTHRNLLGLVIERTPAPAVFAGEPFTLPLVLVNPSARPRHALQLQRGTGPLALYSLQAQAEARAGLPLRAGARGWMRPGRFRVATRYPLGLFQAWSWLEFDLKLLVYPRPAADPPPIPGGGGAGERRGAGERQDRNELDGLRDYRPGDTPREIAWRATARLGQPVSKRFTDPSGGELLLAWDDLGGYDPERRLEILCAWVLRCAESGLRYGLTLPGVQIPPADGEEQRLRCLRALALHGVGA